MKEKIIYAYISLVVLILLVLGISSYVSKPESISELTEKEEVIEPLNGAEIPETQSLTSGIYYVFPSKSQPSGPIVYSDGSTIVEQIPLSSFDILKETIVYTNNADTIFIVQNGEEKKIKVEGLHVIARPSLSPDLNRVAVQASLSPQLRPDGKGLDIFIVDLNSGSFEEISKSEFNAESPEWFHNSDIIAYTTFSPEEGLDIHLHDLSDKKDKLIIDDAGWIHLSVSKDDRLILNPSTMRMYNTSNGKLISDIKEKVISSLIENSYNLDKRSPGQADMGTFPLDASFSPDGKEIVFDGAVEKNGKYGIVLFTINTDGSSLKEVSGLIEVNPEFSNDNRYSQLTPLWK